jgi:hypothetical protein
MAQLLTANAHVRRSSWATTVNIARMQPESLHPVCLLWYAMQTAAIACSRSIPVLGEALQRRHGVRQKKLQQPEEAKTSLARDDRSIHHLSSCCPIPEL